MRTIRTLINPTPFKIENKERSKYSASPYSTQKGEERISRVSRITRSPFLTKKLKERMESSRNQGRLPPLGQRNTSLTLMDSDSLKTGIIPYKYLNASMKMHAQNTLDDTLDNISSESSASINLWKETDTDNEDISPEKRSRTKLIIQKYRHIKGFYDDFKDIRHAKDRVQQAKSALDNSYDISPKSKPQFARTNLQPLHRPPPRYSSISIKPKLSYKETEILNCRINFLDKCQEFNLLPTKLGIVTTTDPKELKEINLESHKMGDNYAQAFGAGIAGLEKTKSINLHNNRLTNRGTVSILENVPLGIQKLDLSKNRMALPSYKLLGNIVNSYERNLRELNLEGVNGEDPLARIISEALCSNRTLSFLNLSRNNITDRGAGYLGNMLTNNYNLNVLFIHWNNIKAKGGYTLAKALRWSDTMQIFDASFNAFGQGFTPYYASRAFSDMFKKNRTLLHLDLSHNSFREKDCKILANGLEKNHSILGIHLLGNEGIIDTKGFIETNKNENPAISQLFCRIPAELETGLRRNRIINRLKVFSNCWICEGWTQIEFKIKKSEIPQELQKRRLPVFVCLEFENYKPDLMDLDETSETYSLVRMVPPGQLLYCYLAENECFSSKECKTLKLDHPCETSISEYKGFEGIAIPETNIVENVILTRQLINHENLKTMKCHPRPILKNLPDRIKTPWHVGISVFKHFVPDNTVVLEKCFELDWNSGKMAKVVKNEEENIIVKEILRKAYRHIKNIYKYFSCLEPVNGVTAISVNLYTDICNQMDIIDHQTLKMSDVDLEFVATNAGQKVKNKNNPERALVRYQLMEIISRLAVRKYFSTGLCTSMSIAIEKLLKVHVINKFGDTDPHLWRRQFLWNEECDLVFKKYLPYIKSIYKENIGRHNMPGETKLMCLEEFTDSLNGNGINENYIAQRDINTAFGLSTITIVNELEGQKHLQLNFTEFIDALGRVAHKILPVRCGGLTTKDVLHPKLRILVERLITKGGILTLESMGLRKASNLTVRKDSKLSND